MCGDSLSRTLGRKASVPHVVIARAIAFMKPSSVNSALSWMVKDYPKDDELRVNKCSDWGSKHLNLKPYYEFRQHPSRKSEANESSY